MSKIIWSQVEGVIFDVDGTLYEQKKLRKIMYFEILLHYIIRPHLWREPLMLIEFRRIREKLGKSSLGQSPEKGYEIIAQKFNVSIRQIKKLVGYWFIDRPSLHLKKCLFPGVLEFIDALTSSGIKVGVFSDYPGEKKLWAIGLTKIKSVCSEDFDVNRLKPDPKGLKKIIKILKIPINRSLFIGNREDLDGSCASSIGMPFLLVQNQLKNNYFDFYFNLLEELNKIENLEAHNEKIF